MTGVISRSSGLSREEDRNRGYEFAAIIRQRAMANKTCSPVLFLSPSSHWAERFSAYFPASNCSTRSRVALTRASSSGPRVTRSRASRPIRSTCRRDASPAVSSSGGL